MLGAIQTGNTRLGLAVSTQPGFSLHYITFQQGTSSIVVANPTIQECLNPGTATFAIVIVGTVRDARGTGFARGDDIQVTVFPANGNDLLEVDLKDTSTGAVEMLVGPFSGNSKLIIQILTA